MAETKQLDANVLESVAAELPSDEALVSNCRKKGGWTTFGFIIGSCLMLGIATSGAFANLAVYLIEQFNIDPITVAQIVNVVNGSTSVASVAGAILSDSCLGCFLVIVISSIVSFMGFIPLTLTAVLPSLAPPPCTPSKNPCEPPSTLQYTVLCAALALVGIGIAGVRYTMVTFGANQFVDPEKQELFVNWYFFAFYASIILASTVVVFVQDKVSWAWGYGICLAANAISVACFFLGKRHYQDVRPQGSPFTAIVRVVIAAVRKRRLALSSNADYYFIQDQTNKQICKVTQEFRCLNKAALLTDGDTHPDGSLAKPWRLCTTQQVEDLKVLIKMVPLWSTSMFLSVSVGIQTSLAILEALTMDRHLGSHFTMPAASYPVSLALGSVIFLAFLDRVVYPICHSILSWSPTLLQRIGVGHMINLTSIAISAIVEARRLHVARDHGLIGQPNSTVPMSALWLVVPLAMAGAGEACALPTLVSLYYEEFPVSLKGTSAAMLGVVIAIGFYVSAAVVKLVRKSTSWLPKDINQGRIDNVLWMLAVVGSFNFCCYVVCAKLYKRQSLKH